MDPLLIGTLIAGATGLVGNFINAFNQHRNNQVNIAANAAINAQNIAFTERWNKINYHMAREAQDAQLAHQQWSRDQYVESTDYNRALQQQIFDREDTAIQRAMSDAQAAGFSPLAALGVPSGAGQVVGNSSIPGSMVSNNQASVMSANQVAPHIQAITGLGDGLSSLGSQVATMAESMSTKQHQKEMQSAEIISSYRRLGMDFVADWLLQDKQNNFLREERNAAHLENLAVIAETAKFQMTMEELRQKGAKILQDDAQQHDLQMQQNEQSHDLQMQQNIQDFEADYRVKTASAAYEDMLALGKEYLVPVVREFSPDLADWLENNSYGSDFLVQMVRSVESTTPLLEGVGNAGEALGDGLWSMNPLSNLNIFGGSKSK